MRVSGAVMDIHAHDAVVTNEQLRSTHQPLPAAFAVILAAFTTVSLLGSTGWAQRTLAWMLGRPRCAEVGTGTRGANEKATPCMLINGCKLKVVDEIKVQCVRSIAGHAIAIFCRRRQRAVVSVASWAWISGRAQFDDVRKTSLRSSLCKFYIFLKLLDVV